MCDHVAFCEEVASLPTQIILSQNYIKTLIFCSFIHIITTTKHACCIFTPLYLLILICINFVVNIQNSVEC